MYNCKFVRDDGATFYFDFDHGIIFDVSPLSQIDVDIATSQGFGQIGESVESQSVGGLTREIKGKIISNIDHNKSEMISVFSPFSEGRLYFNDAYYCECVVDKTPAITVSPKAGTRFDLILFCESPYWLGASEHGEMLNAWSGAFMFPVCYDSHIFGTRNESAFVNIYDSGSIKSTFEVEFSAEADALTNYGLVNIYTLETLTLNDTLQAGETVRVYRDGSRLKVEKTDTDGLTSNIFAALSEDSDLFYLYPGDNVLRGFADGGLQPIVSISYYDTYAGVYDGMD